MMNNMIKVGILTFVFAVLASSCATGKNFMQGFSQGYNNTMRSQSKDCTVTHVSASGKYYSADCQ